MDEQAIAERLIGYNTSNPDGLRSAFGFVKGWLEARDVDVQDLEHRGMPIIACEVGSGEHRLVLHGHLDVVPGHEDQFKARVDGDRLLGRGAYDMKGAVAAMMCAVRELRNQGDGRVLLLLVPDEENEDTEDKASDYLVREGFIGDFVVTGEPTNLQIGVQAKGVLALRVRVLGRSAHGSTPWLGDNAIVKSISRFDQIRELSFTRQSSELFESSSVNLGRILGGDALNKVPDSCIIDLDIRYVPGLEPDQIMEQIAQLPDLELVSHFIREPALVEPDNHFVTTLEKAVVNHTDHDVLSVGRDGTSDAISFLKAGVPAVEFGPTGGGHHGPDEWVSISSLLAFRSSLVDFVHLLPRLLFASG